MRIRRRRRPPTPDPEAARIVELASPPGHPDQVVTDIPRPDALSPVDHADLKLDPTPADFRQAVIQRVAELKSRGALDEGSFSVLDYWIDAQVAAWDDQIVQHAESRRIAAARLVAVDTENLLREERMVHRLQEELCEAISAYRRLRQELTGDSDDVASASPSRSAAEVPDRRTGRVGKLLRGHVGTADNEPEEH